MSHADRHRSPTVVLLLPVVLERFERRPLVDELLRAHGVVAVDPPRVGYRRAGSRWPATLSAINAQRQARRLRKRVGGEVGGVVIFDPGQGHLGHELALLGTDAALLYGPPADVDADTEAHQLTTERAALVFDVSDADPLRDAVADVLLRGQP